MRAEFNRPTISANVRDGTVSVENAVMILDRENPSPIRSIRLDPIYPETAERFLRFLPSDTLRERENYMTAF
jgi:hypothetical protein